MLYDCDLAMDLPNLYFTDYILVDMGENWILGWGLLGVEGMEPRLCVRKSCEEATLKAYATPRPRNAQIRKRD